MSSELSSYEAAIRDLEAERQEIDTLIDGLRRRMDKAGGGTGSISAQRSIEASNIPDDAFFRNDFGRSSQEISRHCKADKDDK